MINPFYILLIILRMIFALYVGWMLIFILAATINGWREDESQQRTTYHHRRRPFKDTEILAQGFPDIRMNEQQHRPLRHAYYRSLIKSRAISLYRDGWVGKLWTHWVGRDAIDEVPNAEGQQS